MEMSLAQQRAQEIYLSTAVLENNFTPNSEVKIAEALKLEGYEASSSSVGRWKKKFEWEKLLHVKVAASVTQDENTKKIIHNSSLEGVVKNTEVDIKRNNILIAASYQALEYEANLILKVVE
jgi:predicted secreted protein